MSQAKESWSDLYKKEDWWAIWFATILIVVVASGLVPMVPKFSGTWKTDPTVYTKIVKEEVATDQGVEIVETTKTKRLAGDMALPLIALFAGLGLLTTIGVRFMGEESGDRLWARYIAGFPLIFLVAILSYVLAHQETMESLGIGYAVWALGLGLLVSNTIGTPEWLKKSARSEMFIKTGLVLLGAEILFGKILKLGIPGLMVAWIVTPTVILFMWYFGNNVLKVASKPLVIIIAAATSVCGVSAAIAVAAASKAKKEELTLAVGMTMIFTVLMMIFMPPLAKFIGLKEQVAGAWLGGTIDSTGAVVAAGAFLGKSAETVAAVVKMIQNVLIGVVAFAVAIYWCARVECAPGEKPSAMEIWYRFPKFILGFLVASLVFSFALTPALGDDAVGGILNLTKIFRGWFFCLAFVSIGLESNFKELASKMEGGKPMLLYVVGQSFNIVLTLAMAWLAFGYVLEKLNAAG